MHITLAEVRLSLAEKEECTAENDDRGRNEEVTCVGSFASR